jgi:hypothetical protein
LIFPGGGQKIKTAADIAQERSAKLKGPRQLESGGTTVTGTLTQFRPPPGFLDATLRGEKVPDQLDTSDTGAMLSQLKAEAGKQHLLKTIPDPDWPFQAATEDLPSMPFAWSLDHLNAFILIQNADQLWRLVNEWYNVSIQTVTALCTLVSA